MLARAERQDLEECIRLLAVYGGEYRSKFGVLSFTGSLDLLSRETTDDDQATRMADAMEIVVGMLGSLKKEHPKHKARLSWLGGNYDSGAPVFPFNAVRHQ
jgi:hypothetical protein